MNRLQALAWLVENVTKWPVDITKTHSGQQYDFWLSNAVDIIFCVWDDIDEDSQHITQQDWLDATDTL